MIEIATQNTDLASKRSELETQKRKAKELNDKIESDINELDAKIEELERIRLGEFFGIPKEEMFKEVRVYGRREIIGFHSLTSDHCKKLVDNKDGTGYVFSTTRSGACNTADGEINIYSGARPKKGSCSYRGIRVEFDVWQAPNGLWFGDHCGTHAKDGSAGGLRSVAIDDVSVAFQTQKEVLDYCCRRAIQSLTYKRIDEDPEEIEERCPDCTAWAQKHLQITIEEGETPQMWSPEMDYKQYHDHEIIGCTETEYCPTCDSERPDSPWFGPASVGDDSNKITRTETAEETAKRVAEERERPIFGKQQPDADKLVAKLEAMLGISSKPSKVNSDQLELAL